METVVEGRGRQVESCAGWSHWGRWVAQWSVCAANSPIPFSPRPCQQADSDAGGQGWGQRLCISNKLPGAVMLLVWDHTLRGKAAGDCLGLHTLLLPLPVSQQEHPVFNASCPSVHQRQQCSSVLGPCPHLYHCFWAPGTDSFKWHFQLFGKMLGQKWKQQQTLSGKQEAKYLVLDNYFSPRFRAYLFPK